MKDLFSEGALQYAKFRPGYPQQLFDHLLSLVPCRESALDCGTGNGQVAVALSNYFKEVYATDISGEQLAFANQKSNINYSVQPAENTLFENGKFDLLTVAQAVHWFDFSAFYIEVKRILKPGGIIAIIGYGLLTTEGEINNLINHFYRNVVGTFWDAERKFVDEHYQTIPFPFNEIASPEFSMKYDWTSEQLIGYLETWSAVKHYKKAVGQNPINVIADKLDSIWGNERTHPFTFPIFVRVGRK